MEINANMSEQMLKQYGPVMNGKDLYLSLGFKTYSAFYRAMQLKELGVDVFRLPKRRGWFAKTTEVASWINAQAKGGSQMT